MSLHFIIIGAGLAGLSAGLATKLANPDHKVTILESVKELAEIGVSLEVLLQIPYSLTLPSTSSRISVNTQFDPSLQTWGIYDRLCPLATFPKALTVRRYDGTKILVNEPKYQEIIDRKYGSPFWGMHRVDLQRTMAERVRELGVVLRLGARVVDVDFENAVVSVVNRGEGEGDEGGEIEVVRGDVVLCADGLWSTLRSKFLRTPSPPTLTGDLAYRIVLNTSEITGPNAPELISFIKSSTVNFWIGPGTHVVAYTMRAGEVYNIVLLCPDDLPADISKTKGDVEQMRHLFEGWDPLLRRFLEQVREVAKWKLMWLETLPEWVNKEGTFLMAGDSCHPMLPYLAQGANSSLEDGAVLGFLLSKVSYANRKSQLPKMAQMYQELRKARGEGIAKMTFEQRQDFHMEDGEEQVIRDELLLGIRQDKDRDFPSRWMCGRVQPWLYGYDAYGMAEEAFRRNPY